MNIDFWKKRKVFITGHTGFKGSWTTLWLKKMGADVKGYSLKPNTTPSLYNILELENDILSEFGDICDIDILTKSIQKFKPEIIFHMAAQPLVRESYVDPIKTYQTNVMGTLNLFEAIRKTDSVKAVVNITSDKCYQNHERTEGYKEHEPMGGYDPYSNSKGCAELITSSYRSSFFNNNNSSKVALASVRAGNVIGGGDWAKDRLIPDILRAFEKNEIAIIRNPDAVRPWQHVLEPISGYFLVAEKLYKYGQEYAEGWNFGPKESDSRAVKDVIDFIMNNWSKEVTWTLDKKKNPHEAMLLKLDISKAKTKLNWEPIWSLEKTLLSIIKWHEAWMAGNDIKSVTLNQIDEYEKSIRNKYE